MAPIPRPLARVILVNRFFFPDESATAQLLTDLARHLSAQREVIVLTSRQRLEGPDARLAPQEALGSVRIHRLWSTALGRNSLPGRAVDYLSFLGSVKLWLLFKVRRGDVVLAKTDPPLLGVVTTLATLGRRVRRVQWLQDLYPETAVALGVISADGFLTRLARGLRNWSLRHSDLVVTVSAGMQADLRGRAGQAAVEHIPNWAEDFGALHGGGEKPFVVGYSGNLGRAHPIDGLLQLAGMPPDPALRYVISGGGAHYERLRLHVTQLARQDWTFVAYQPREHLAELLRRPDLHLVILDPRVERCIFPSKIYGILSAGRPILHLGNPAGEVAALLREHGCGWSVAADAGVAIRARIEELRAAPEALQEAGRRARAAYERHFTRAHALARWEEALQALP